MVKSKLKPLAAVALKSNNCQKSSSKISKFADDIELPEEDSWVIVKKQKVTILIPRLPSSEQCILPNLNLSDEQLSEDIRNNITSAQPQHPHHKSPEVCVAERHDGFLSLFPNSVSEPVRKNHALPDKVAAIAKPGKPGLRVLNMVDKVGAFGSLCQHKRSLLRYHRMCHKPWRTAAPPEHPRVCSLWNCTTVLNKMMRAANLERKIARAGGLRKWLSSLGLEQFERILCGTNAGKFQLANMSMKKLKDMGYHGVGPRRKLIHAIECTCEPNCSETQEWL